MPENDPPNKPTPHDNISDEERAELLALRKDLNIYDDPEVFYRADSDLLAKFRITTTHLSARPDILRTELEGKNLFAAIRAAALIYMRQGMEERGEDHDEQFWDEYRDETYNDPDYLKAEQEMFYFFVRYFPRLLINVYDLTIQASVIFGAKRVMDDSDWHKIEADIKQGLEHHVKLLRSDIKRMLGTRSSGRPRKIETADPLPKIVDRVVDVAIEMMGEQRGRDAVPGLKTIAETLGLSVGALGVQLRRAGYPWTRIKTHLENRT